MTDARISRVPRRAVNGLPSAKYALLVALLGDARFGRMSPRGGQVLVFCLVVHSDGRGRFWPRHDTVAAQLKTSSRTVRRALDEACTLGLLRKVERYQRPDGTLSTWTYEPADIPDPPADTVVQSPCEDISDQSTCEDTDVRADPVLDQKKNLSGGELSPAEAAEFLKTISTSDNGLRVPTALVAALRKIASEKEPS